MAKPKKFGPPPMAKDSPAPSPAPENDVAPVDDQQGDSAVPDAAAPQGGGDLTTNEGTPPMSEDEKQLAKAAIDAIGAMLYKNEKVRKAVVEMTRKPPYIQAIADAVMLLINHVRDQGVSIPDHLIAGIALKTMEMVMDLGMSLGFLPQDEKLVAMATEKTLRAISDDYEADPQVLVNRQKQISPGQGLLE